MTGNSGDGGRPSLEKRMQEIESWRKMWADPKIKSVEDAAEDAERRIGKLEGFQRLVLGIGAAIGAAGGLFLDEIKKRIGIG